MEGRSAVAIEAARKVAANVRLEMIEQFPGVEFFNTIPLLALTQFGRWDDVLAEPQPAENLEYSNAIWHYVRATAFARLYVGLVHMPSHIYWRVGRYHDASRANIVPLKIPKRNLQIVF